MASLIVLAGGLGKRLGGTKKPLIKIGGAHILTRAITRLSHLVHEVIVVDNDDSLKVALPQTLPCRIVPDLVFRGGALIGLLSGLAECKSTWAIVVAGDMPFLSPTLFASLLNIAKREDADVCIFMKDERLEPTHAVYKVDSCRSAAQKAVDAGESRLISFHPLVRRVYIAKLEEVDCDGDANESFFNVNTPSDVQVAEKMSK